MAILNEVLPSDAEITGAGCQAFGIADAIERLERGFGAELAIVDGATGELVRAASEPPGNNWDVRGQVCRQVAQGGRPELIEEEGPFAVLALPLDGSGSGGYVAVGTFLTRPTWENEDLSLAAGVLGWGPQEAAEWAARQTPWPPESLRRVGDLALGYLAERDRAGGLEEEAQSLSLHLASTYEEISLLYRLTRNLKISKSEEDLGRVALEWLVEVLPAEGLALRLFPVAGQEQGSTAPARATAKFLTHGRCPLDGREFARLIDSLDVGVPNQPVVVNRSTTQQNGWPYPRVRQMIAVPLGEGANLLGWLAGLNHVEDGEFGTVEASLLSSVAAILGIHGGNIELYRQQSELLAGIVRALTSAIDAKDPYTCGHSDRVARVAVRLARELGCDAKMIDTIYLSGLLHDIGKIGIDDSVLRKPSKLTDEEYEHIKRHVEIGHRILMDLKKLDDLLPVVLHHHESWDGSGYPQHLPAEEIPLPARIVAVADAFDAMGSDRPYRKGLPDEKIDEVFRSGAGKQWDPDVVEALFRARDVVRQIVRREREAIEIAVPPFP